MKRPLLALSAAAVMALTSACNSNGGTDDPETEPSSPQAEESREVSTAPAVLSYGELTGFEMTQEAAGPILEYEQAGVAGFHLEGADPQEAIYVVNYRLDEATTEWDFDARSAISATYDELTGNESEAGSMHAITGGRESVFRYAVFRAPDDKYVYQWNTFVFDGFDVVQITCQWRNERELIQAGCQDLQAGFSIDRG